MSLDLKRFVITNEMILVAHRGCSGDAPENTIAAINRALDLGLKMIEVDIQISKDKRIILHHDDELGRTSKGIGKISDMTYDDLRSIDAGAWFSEKYAGEALPLLEDVLELVKDKAFIVIEVKPLSDSLAVEKLNALAELIQAHNAEKMVIFASFDYSALKHLKSICPDFIVAAIHLPGDSPDPALLKADIPCEGLICSVEELTPELARKCKSAGLGLGVYGVDTPEDYEYAKQFHIKGYGSNYPERILEYLNNK